MSQTISQDVAPTSVTDDLVQLDQVFTDASTRRRAVADMLATTVEDMKFDFTSPRTVEVQLQLVGAYLGVLKDAEAAIGRRVSAKQRKTEADAQNKHSAEVAGLLARVASGQITFGARGAVPSDEAKTASIENAFIRHGLEPVLDTELRTDPKDIEP